LERTHPEFMTLFKKPEIRFSDQSDRSKSGLSFPSGHVTDNVIIGTFCALFFRRGWLYFIVAAAVAYSRIYLGAHWPSDVVATTFMAAGVALLFAALVEFLWRKVAPRWAPRLFARHPRLIGDAVT
ncbi:MAG: phosphatase PAP2 family protein, partial [Verrucomicrobiaceae bacterium]|nr:phosphatase PAP2 family protein [Verrucomicrobiaceae bacterium]